LGKRVFFLSHFVTHPANQAGGKGCAHLKKRLNFPHPDSDAASRQADMD
jgi:hypothetical protein